MGENDKIEQSEGKVNVDEQNPEYKKLLKRQQATEAQMQALMNEKMAWEQQMEDQRVTQEVMWTDSQRLMVSKNALIDLYFNLFCGANENQTRRIINALCNSISSFSGQEQEGMMLVDKNLMNALKYYNENRDMENLFVTSNQIMYTLSAGQRETIVRILIADIQQNGGIEDMQLVENLKESIHNPRFFRC
jgi:hypothetical protein